MTYLGLFAWKNRMEIIAKVVSKGGLFSSDPLLLKSQVLGVLRNVLFLCIIWITD